MLGTKLVSAVQMVAHVYGVLEVGSGALMSVVLLVRNQSIEGWAITTVYHMALRVLAYLCCRRPTTHELEPHII
jgi:hypothetical protein